MDAYSNNEGLVTHVVEEFEDICKGKVKVIGFRYNNLIMDAHAGNLKEELPFREEDFDCDYVIDFSGLRMIGSTCLGIFIGVTRNHEKYRDNRPLSFVNMQGNVKEVFSITNLDQFFDIYESLDDYKNRHDDLNK